MESRVDDRRSKWAECGRMRLQQRGLRIRLKQPLAHCAMTNCVVAVSEEPVAPSVGPPSSYSLTACAS